MLLSTLLSNILTQNNKTEPLLLQLNFYSSKVKMCQLFTNYIPLYEVQFTATT